ncbi:hypothetical protein [Aridibaculum aurantiacum]|uniref:hypothetical protein n=1 Tax=Aridibaculum aurantiacum TaxID=2810307 RepID=UPI001A975B27|nr:hypothetical protein [Aridibaculum aurantiacum]
MILVVLVVVSSITPGYVSTITSVLAGLVMIVLGLAVTVWIIKTPAKSKEEGVSN